MLKSTSRKIDSFDSDLSTGGSEIDISRVVVDSKVNQKEWGVSLETQQQQQHIRDQITTTTTTSPEVLIPSETMDGNYGKDSIILPDSSPLYAQSMASHLWTLYKSKSCTDIRVRCGEHTYDLHSCVLSHGSSYFQQILATTARPKMNPTASTNTTNTTTTKTTTTTIELKLAFPATTITRTTFELIIESLYTGTTCGITEFNVTLLLGASHDLQILHIIDATCNFMLQRLNVHNCLEYYLAAKLCNRTHPLQLEAIGYIGRHLRTISRTQFFLELEECTIIDMLVDDGLQVPSEHVVYDAGMAWIKYDIEGRKESLNDILETIRLPLLSVDFLIRVVGKEYLIEEDHDAVNKYSYALQYKLNANACQRDDNRLSPSSFSSQRKSGYSVLDKNVTVRHRFSYRVKGAWERFITRKSFGCWRMGGDDDNDCNGDSSTLNVVV